MEDASTFVTEYFDAAAIIAVRNARYENLGFFYELAMRNPRLYTGDKCLKLCQKA